METDQIILGLVLVGAILALVSCIWFDYPALIRRMWKRAGDSRAD